MQASVVAIHGILTRTTTPSWPDYLDAFLVDCKVERRDYFAWPLPTLNFFIKNPLLAHYLAAEVALLAKNGMPLHFVAHSNGCDIAIRTIKILTSKGIRVDSVILTGSITDPDIDECGIANLIDCGLLGAAWAYCSSADMPLQFPLKWPYRDLGRRGWQRNGAAYLSDHIRTRNFPGYGHSGYFNPEANRLLVFAQMREDMRLL